MKEVEICEVRFNKSLKWSDLFDSEAELVNLMFSCNTDDEEFPYFSLCKGYGYLHSFKSYYSRNGKLTDKQMTQLKRLAKVMYEHLVVVKKITRYHD